MKKNRDNSMNARGMTPTRDGIANLNIASPKQSTADTSMNRNANTAASSNNNNNTNNNNENDTITSTNTGANIDINFRSDSVDLTQNENNSSNNDNTNEKPIIVFNDSPLASEMLPRICLLGVTKSKISRLLPIECDTHWQTLFDLKEYKDSDNEKKENKNDKGDNNEHMCDIEDASFLLFSQNRKLLRFGGLYENAYVNNVDCIDLENQKWYSLPKLQHIRHGHRTIVADNCEQYVITFGGYDARGNTLKSCELADFHTMNKYINNNENENENENVNHKRSRGKNKRKNISDNLAPFWDATRITPMPYGVADFGTCSDLNQHRIYVAGGLNEQFQSVNRVMFCDTYKNQWYKDVIPKLNHKRHLNNILVWQGCCLAVFGGYSGKSRQSVELLDLRENNKQWKLFESPYSNVTNSSNSNTNTQHQSYILRSNHNIYSNPFHSAYMPKIPSINNMMNTTTSSLSSSAIFRHNNNNNNNDNLGTTTTDLQNERLANLEFKFDDNDGSEQSKPTNKSGKKSKKKNNKKQQEQNDNINNNEDDNISVSGSVGGGLGGLRRSDWSSNSLASMDKNDNNNDDNQSVMSDMSDLSVLQQATLEDIIMRSQSQLSQSLDEFDNFFNDANNSGSNIKNKLINNNSNNSNDNNNNSNDNEYKQNDFQFDFGGTSSSGSDVFDGNAGYDGIIYDGSFGMYEASISLNYPHSNCSYTVKVYDLNEFDNKCRLWINAKQREKEKEKLLNMSNRSNDKRIAMSRLEDCDSDSGSVGPRTRTRSRSGSGGAISGIGNTNTNLQTFMDRGISNASSIGSDLPMNMSNKKQEYIQNIQSKKQIVTVKTNKQQSQSQSQQIQQPMQQVVPGYTILVCGHREGLFIESNVIEALEMRTGQWHVIAKFKDPTIYNQVHGSLNASQLYPSFQHRYDDGFRFLTFL